VTFNCRLPQIPDKPAIRIKIWIRIQDMALAISQGPRTARLLAAAFSTPGMRFLPAKCANSKSPTPYSPGALAAVVEAPNFRNRSLAWSASFERG
jgi:hypothetical protein